MKILFFKHYVLKIFFFFFLFLREHMAEAGTFKMVLLMAGTQERITPSRRVLATWWSHPALLINRWKLPPNNGNNCSRSLQGDTICPFHSAWKETTTVDSQPPLAISVSLSLSHGPLTTMGWNFTFSLSDLVYNPLNINHTCFCRTYSSSALQQNKSETYSRVHFDLSVTWLNESAI